MVQALMSVAPKIRKNAAIGILEFNAATPAMVAAKWILENYNVALLQPCILGSGTITLIIAGSVEDVSRATDKNRLMPDNDSVVGIFHKANPIIGTQCFAGPSKALWDVMREIGAVPADAVDLAGEEFTLGIFEAQGMTAFLEALRYLRKEGDVQYIGHRDVGSQHLSGYFYGEHGQVKHTKFDAKTHIRTLVGDRKLKGSYHGSWFLDSLPPEMMALLPWKPSPRPFKGENSFLVLETCGLTALTTAANDALWRGGKLIGAQEFGSGREAWVLHSSSVEDINMAGDKDAIERACAKNPNGAESLINVRTFHRPEELFGEQMSELEPSTPRFSMRGLSIGLVDTVHRGLLYDALDILKKYNVRFIGTRKLGARQAFMCFAGKQADVEMALDEIAKDAEQKLAREERTGELYSLGIIANPHEELLRVLPWQSLSKFIEGAPAGYTLPEPYYSPLDPFAVVETVGLAQQIAIANAILHHTGISPVSTYSVGSGLEIWHYASRQLDYLREVTTKDFLFRACEGMQNNHDMILNAVPYARSRVLWQAVDHVQPMPVDLMQRLSAPGVALGAVTVRGMHSAFFFLDRLKDYGELNVWTMKKSGGKHVTDVIYGPQDQVRDAMSSIPKEMLDLQRQGALSGETRSWVTLDNPHPELAFLLPRENRVGV